MSFQGSINQLLTMAGTAAMLSPTLRGNVEKRQHMEDLKKREKALIEQFKTVSKKNTNNIIPEVAKTLGGQTTGQDVKDIKTAVNTVRGDLLGETGALIKERFLLEPNQENLKNLVTSNVIDQKLKRYQSAQESAQQSLNLKQEEVRPKSERKGFKLKQSDVKPISEWSKEDKDFLLGDNE